MCPAPSSKLPYKGLDAAKLLPGDVVLTSDETRISRAIQTMTRSDISHAMIYVESHSIIDANREGVHARNTQRLHFPADCALYVLRAQPPLTPAEADAVVRYARQAIGSQYSIAEAVQSVSPIRTRPGRKQFCSRLIGQAYASADRRISGTPDFLSPGDLLRSTKFRRVTDAIADISADEAAKWARYLDMTQVMRDTTNAVLDAVRSISDNIQTFSDIDALLISAPQHDRAILAAYEQSGYLDAWQAEKQRNAWQYDLQSMQYLSEQAPDDVEAYCRSIVGDRSGTSDRYKQNLAAYEAMHALFALKTFDRLRALYATLAELDALRVVVADAWLAERAPATPTNTSVSDADV